MIDLPETLFFSFIFLRAHFPQASYKFVTAPGELKELNPEEFDLIFIPAEFYREIPRWRIDLAVNSHSLGEMRQAMVEDYMQMLEKQLDVRFFYSLNRYLQTPEDINIHSSSDYQATCSLVLDPYWDVQAWNYTPDFVVSQRYGHDTRTTLEVLLERVPPERRNLPECVVNSRELLREAAQIQNIKSHRWHRLMWESIVLNPCEENVRPYYEFLKAANSREYFYYHKLLRSWNARLPDLPSGKLSLRQKVAKKILSLSRRIANVIAG